MTVHKHENGTEMSAIISVDVPIAWEYVRTVRQEVEAALSDYPEEVRSAAVMVSSELIENAIKYGAMLPSLKSARFRLEPTPESITIQVFNGVKDSASLDIVRQMIKAMEEPGAAERLYLSRLQELVRDPAQPNRLGLYRIEYEGKFSLEFNYVDQILTMTARRRIL